MIGKKIRKGLVAGIVCLSLVLAQGVVLAASQDVSENTNISTSKTIIASTGVVGGVYRITGDGVAVRSSPSTSSTRLGLLYAGSNDWILVSAVADGWVYGKTSTGIYGWVSDTYIERIA
jgi:K+ transporter